MATVVQSEPRRVVGGVDTHKDVYVAAVIDAVGRALGSENFPTTGHGYRCLLSWLRSHGEVVAVGVEGIGSWGAGLARYLMTCGVTVVEVNRPTVRTAGCGASPMPLMPKRPLGLNLPG